MSFLSPGTTFIYPDPMNYPNTNEIHMILATTKRDLPTLSPKYTKKIMTSNPSIGSKKERYQYSKFRRGIRSLIGAPHGNGMGLDWV